MPQLTWEEKLQALQWLCDTSLRMRRPGDWYINTVGRQIRQGGSAILSACYGNGSTPELAVLDDWKKVATGLPSTSAVLVQGKAYQWHGFGWKEVTE